MPHNPSHIRRAQRRVIEATLRFLPFNVESIIDEALRVSPQDPLGYAYARILDSKPFRRRFPGIFRKDGSLRLSPQEYIERERSFADIASQHGFIIKRTHIGRLINNDVDPEEFVFRARAFQTVRNNPDIFTSFQDVVKEINSRRGPSARLPEIRTMKGAVGFVLNQSDPRLYTVYESATLLTAARRAGLALDPLRARQIAGTTAGVPTLEEAEQTFAEIAQQLEQAGPEIAAFLQGEDPQRALEVVRFGGKDRAQLAEKVARALAQRAAAQETTPAAPRLALTPQGRPVAPGAAREPGL